MIAPPTKSICIFVPSLRGGGAEKIVVTIANFLASQNYNVDLVVLTDSGAFQCEVSSSVHIINLNRSRLISAIIPLRKVLVTNKYDLVFSAMKHANILCLVAMLGFRSWPTLILSEHSPPISSIRMNFSIKMLCIKYLMVLLYPFADHVVCVSNSVLSELQRLVPRVRNTSVIYNPVNLNEVDYLKRDRHLHRWFLDNDNTIILTAGRLVHDKDYHSLLKAFALLKKSVKALKLVVLGDGPLRNELELLCAKECISGSVHFAGFVHNPHAWMLNSHLFVLSSRLEGFGNVIVEAMSCGIPVVATDCPGGVSEILENGKWGSLVPVSNPTAFCDAMLKALSDPVPDVKSRAQDFSGDITLSNYKNLFSSLLD